jgi:hypothetical protein
MPATLQSFVARETRYKIVFRDAVAAQVVADADGAAIRLNAELIDISTGGVRLCSDAPLADGAGLMISVITGDKSNPITVRAEVCWTTLASKGRFYSGCSIEPPIPQRLLDDLAATGILERRQEVRQETSVTLPARWELDNTPCEAAVLNISSGGLSLLMPQRGKVGQRLCLTAADENGQPTRVYVKARWQVNTKEGSVVGCEINDRATYLRLARAVACALGQ